MTNEVKGRRWKPYPAYKPSGIEWLGDVPAPWEAKRLKRVCQINPSKSELASISRDTEVSFLPMELVGNGTLTLERTKPLGEVRQGFTYFRDQDVIVAKITPSFENGKGALVSGLVNGIGFGTTELHVIRSGNSVAPEFLYYLTISHYFRATGVAWMYGTAGQQRVSDSFLKDLFTPLPSLDEQRAIAAFLDRETAKLDALIARHEQLIELLQEKRTALISHAVTKGLDPSAPMKDSGVPWLGNMPKHWQIKKLKFVVSFIDGDRGKEYPTENDFVEQGIPFLSSKNIIDDKLVLDEVRFISTAKFDILGRGKLCAGDLVITVRGTIGSVGFFDGAEHPTGFINAQMMIIRVRKEMVPQFLHLVTQGDSWRTQLDFSAYGAAQQQLSNEILCNLVAPIPPEDEQREIVSKVGETQREMDELISKVNNAIDRLREYRAALISAAVTGKVDVRATDGQRISALVTS